MAAQFLKCEESVTVDATSASIAVTSSFTTLTATLGAQIVTDITWNSTGGLPIIILRNGSVNNVTLQHNNSKLRNNGGTDVVLTQYDAVMYIYISGTVWQQIGGLGS